MRRLKKIYHRTKHFLVPHKGNRYRPGLFARQSLAAIALALIIVEGLFVLESKLALNNNGFVASVLPAALHALANQDRASNGLAVLTEDPALAAAAQAKADDMATRGYFAHTSPDGKTLRTWLDAKGYSFTYAGENLAVDFTESSDVERAWMNSPTHRANLLKAEYTHVGFGVARGMFEGREVTFVAQFFASKGAERSPNAVATADTSPKSIVQDEDVRVLGTDTVDAPPAKAVAKASVTVAQETIEDVQEVEAAPISIQERAAVAATSPMSSATFVILSVGALLAIVAGIVMLVHMKVGIVHVEMIAGVAVVAAIAFLIVFYNGQTEDDVRIDAAAQTATQARGA